MDGILGLSQEKPHENINKFEAIYDVMYEQGLISERSFGLCLGKNGGYFQIGGYDKQGYLEEDLTWIPMTKSKADFFVRMQGMMMNNHYMAGTHINSNYLLPL